jgi:hypothetical protein
VGRHNVDDDADAVDEERWRSLVQEKAQQEKRIRIWRRSRDKKRRTNSSPASFAYVQEEDIFVDILQRPKAVTMAYRNLKYPRGEYLHLQASIYASTPCPPENHCTKRYLTWHNFNWDIFRAGDKIACSCRFTFILRMAFLYILKK